MEENITKEKIESIYHFRTPYENGKNTQYATVVLEINYGTKDYSIKPFCGTKDFKFERTSHKYKMWLALLKSIEAAILFAQEEINNIPE